MRIALATFLVCWVGCGGDNSSNGTDGAAVLADGPIPIDAPALDSPLLPDAAVDRPMTIDAPRIDAPMVMPDASADPVLQSLKFQTSGPITVAVGPTGAPIIAGGLINQSRFGDITLVAAAMMGNPVTAADLFVVAFSAAGMSTWGNRFGDPTDQLGSAIAVNANGVILVAGVFSGDLQFTPTLTLTSPTEISFLAAFNGSTGDVQWATALDLGAGGFILGLAADPTDNGFVVAATATAAVNFRTFAGTAGGGKDLFVAKLSAAGDLGWARQIGGTGDQIARAVAVDPSGHPIVVGQFGGTLDFGTGALPAPPVASSKDIFVAKLDTTGAAMQAVAIGARGNHIAEAVAADATSVVIAGYLAGGTVRFNAATPIMLSPQGQDGFVAKLSTDLQTTAWARRIGEPASSGDPDGGTPPPPSPQEATGVAIDSAGHVIVVGAFQGTVDFAVATPTAILTDAFALKLDPSGSPVWVRTTGGSQDEKATAVGVNRQDDSVWVVGTFTAATTMPPIPNWGGSVATELVFPMDDGTQGHTFQVRLLP
jgi:hypothetical protein